MLTSRNLHVLPAVFLLLLLSGCAVTNKFGPYMGKVVDAETEKPIEGAVVFMECSSLSPTLAGSQYHYIDAKEVLTNSKGEFYIELRVNTLRPGHFWERPKFIIFKPGYGVYPDYPGSSSDITIKDAPSFFPENKFVTIRLPKLLTKNERKNNLSNTYTGLEVPYKNKEKLYRLVNEERSHLGLEQYPTPIN